jgi:outer membrane protein OmpA-like peptidoglycan-associated protein
MLTNNSPRSPIPGPRSPIKKVCLTFIIFHFSLFICSAQSTATEIETLLATGAVTNAQAAWFLLQASETMSTSDHYAAFRYAQEHQWLPRNAVADSPARLDAVSLLLMQSFDISGSFMYSWFKSPHYAYRDLKSNNILQGRIDPAMNVSGAYLLYITSRILTVREAEEAIAAEKERLRLLALEQAWQNALAEERARADEQARQNALAEECARADEQARQNALAEERARADEQSRQNALAEERARADEQARQNALAEERARADEQARQNALSAAAAENDRQRLRAIELTRQNIMFQPDSAVLLESERRKLDALATILRTIPGTKIQIEGHSALAGTVESQLDFALQRAEAVASYLISLGAVNASDVTIIAHGADRPTADNSTTEGMVANRRVEIVILEN